MSAWSRLTNVFRPRAVDHDLEEEQRFHLEARTRDLVARGLSADAAAREAARRFGSRSRHREDSRDVRIMPWLDALVRDVKLGTRRLRKDTTVTTTAVLSLGLALGACLAAATLVDALVFRPLPVQRPDQLVHLAFPTGVPERPESDTFNDPLFLRLRDAARESVDLFAMSTQVIRPILFAGTEGEKESLRTQFVSGDAFERLGIRPRAGRLIVPDDDRPSGTSIAAVLSDAFWQRRFGGDPDIVGRRFSMQDREYQIVGVAERAFTGVEPGRVTDVWLPYAAYNPRAFGNAAFNWFRVFGRLRPGARPDDALRVLQPAFGGFNRERAERGGTSPETMARVIATPLYVRSAATGPSPLRRDLERPLWILAAIAMLVLLVAGSNVTNLLLARGASREREMALRLSIGAGRARLIQQVLVESALLTLAACVIGPLVARTAVPFVTAMLTPADDPIQIPLRLDWRLMTVAAGVALLTTALAGLAPALRASGVAPSAALKSGGRGNSGVRMMRPFVAIQVAFGIVVLFVGGLLVLSFARLSHVDPGFTSASVLQVSLEPVRPLEPAVQREAVWQVLDRLREVPGVQAVSAAEFGLLGRAWTSDVPRRDNPLESIDVTLAPVTPGFFETMNIARRAGRVFTRQDLDAPVAPIVVNETFAAQYFGADLAVGRTIEARFGEDDHGGPHEVVGVVADTKYDLRKAAAPVVYIPLPLQFMGTIRARVAGDPAAMAPRLRDAARAATTELRVRGVSPQTVVIEQSLLRERLLAWLSAFFALVGLTLVGLGLYGVLSYTVLQRTREIGIRVALGARRSSVIRTVVAEVAIAASAGAAAGLFAGLYLSRFVATMLFEVRPLDMASLVLPVASLVAVAILAAARPAWRAARVDPVIALREE